MESYKLDHGCFCFGLSFRCQKSYSAFLLRLKTLYECMLLSALDQVLSKQIIPAASTLAQTTPLTWLLLWMVM